MLDEFDDTHTEQRQDRHPQQEPQGARRELYSALMSGFGTDEQHELEELMHENEERLRELGDGYAP